MMFSKGCCIFGASFVTLLSDSALRIKWFRHEIQHVLHLSKLLLVSPDTWERKFSVHVMVYSVIRDYQRALQIAKLGNRQSLNYSPVNLCMGMFKKAVHSLAFSDASNAQYGHGLAASQHFYMIFQSMPERF
jgi:hypothetical protein